MMKNVRIQNDFLALINDLVKVLKEDVSKIKTHEKDYSFLEKYSRSNMFEKMILRSFPYYINLAKIACMESGNFTTMATVQDINERFVDYSTRMYDIHNANNDYKTGRRDKNDTEEVTEKNSGRKRKVENCITCSVSIEQSLWNGMCDLSKSLSAGLGMEMNLSNLIKGCMIKGIEFYIRIAEDNIQKAKQLGVVATDFAKEIKNLKLCVSERLSALNQSENPLKESYEKFKNSYEDVVKNDKKERREAKLETGNGKVKIGGKKEKSIPSER